jgi:hypothetical protein
MATQVIKQFLGTIRSGTSFTWSMANANPPFPDVNFNDRQPKWIVEWQAVPIFLAPDTPAADPAKPGIRIDPVTIVEEQDTSQTHVFTITCSDFANTGAGFVATYVLYAIFTDVN